MAYLGKVLKKITVIPLNHKIEITDEEPKLPKPASGGEAKPQTEIAPAKENESV